MSLRLVVFTNNVVTLRQAIITALIQPVLFLFKLYTFCRQLNNIMLSYKYDKTFD